MSVTANTDSMTISSTIGTARTKIARPSGASVRSRCVPRSASRSSAQSEVGGVGSEVLTASM